VQFISDRLNADQPVAARLDAARLLAMLPLNDEQRIGLAGRLAQADAMVLSTLLRAFERGESEPVGLALVKSLQSGGGAANLPPDELARLIGRYPPAVTQAARPLMSKLGVDPAAQKAKLDALSEMLTGGDIGRGKQVFFGLNAACATCHRVSGQGGLLGPNLTTIAEIRSGRDLLESVIYPSASIVQGFRPYVVQTRDGRAIVGLLTRQTSDAFWFRGIDQVETRIDAANLASMTEASSSLMPQGLDARLSRDELRDLLAFLQSCKRLSSFLPDQH
jgi:putative heme-binding domain-containing protein